MIAIPPGFDLNELVLDFISIAVPIVPVFLIIQCYMLIRRSLR